ncbi:mandelate racemase/muconate lactonizing enzyme family protein [Georgenia sp. Z1344]|uniref:mandelate racemase/muconate lactonizing enzyme family protein n=1 Tax=Georgenia sp. Z1344 TaxID=3416706 RepID=UPI003CF77FE5
MGSSLIDQVDVRILEVPLNKPYWMSQQAYATAGQVFVTVRTAGGVLGYGQAHGNPMTTIADLVTDTLAPLVLGRSVWEVRAIWRDLFAVSTGKREAVATGQPHFGMRDRFQLLAGISALDIAIWDARAKTAGLPLWKLLGADNPVLPAYATGGYYPNGDNDDPGIDSLLAEIGAYVDAGFTAVKIKTGRAPEVDIARVRAIRDDHPDLRIKADSNGGWDLDEALTAGRAFSDLGVFWMEEPIHWHLGTHHLRRLRDESGLRMAAGEQEIHQWSSASLVDEGVISVLQTDCTRAGGLTAWMEVATYANLRGVAVAPHHDGHIHGHFLAALSGEVHCETFPDSDRDPLWARLYGEKPELVNGALVLSERPGLGITPDSGQLDAWTIRQTTIHPE